MRLVEFVSAQSAPAFDTRDPREAPSRRAATEEEVSDEDEELVEKCLEIMRQEKRAHLALPAPPAPRLHPRRAHP